MRLNVEKKLVKDKKKLKRRKGLTAIKVCVNIVGALSKRNFYSSHPIFAPVVERKKIIKIALVEESVK